MRHRLTARGRAQIKRELNARLQAIGEETEGLRPQLQCRSPSRAAVAQYKALAKLCTSCSQRSPTGTYLAGTGLHGGMKWLEQVIKDERAAALQAASAKTSSSHRTGVPAPTSVPGGASGPARPAAPDSARLC